MRGHRLHDRGRVDEHKQRFSDYRLTKTKVELLLLFGVHAALDLRGAGRPLHRARRLHGVPRHPLVGVRQADVFRDRKAYLIMPAPIKRWIDDNGGHHNLPMNGYWTLYDRQMWAMGYAKCK
jgi:hypothetical protein